MSISQGEDWEKNVELAKQKASEIQGEFADYDREIRDSWGRMERLAARIHEVEEEGDVGEVGRISEELRDFQRIGIEASIGIQQGIAYQNAFEEWLSTQEDVAANEEVQEQIRTIREIQAQTERDHSRLSEALNRQRQEVSLLYQGLNNVHVVGLIRLVSDANAKLTKIGVLITAVGVVVGILAIAF